jgi:hypothetical protein
MKMGDVEKALSEELETIEIHDDFNLRKNINELCYSAEEIGLLPCRVDDDMAILIWKLVEIARMYGENLPSKFKM